MLSLMWDPVLVERMGQLVNKAARVFTVCTGSVLLAAGRRLDGKRATTDKSLFDELMPKCKFQSYVVLAVGLSLTAIYDCRPERSVAKACSLGAG